MIDMNKLKEYQVQGNLQLTEKEGKEFLNAYGINTPKNVSVNTIEEALNKVKEIGYPVVLKGQLRSVTHKSDLGLVALNIKNDEELKIEFEKMSKRCEDIEKDYQILIEQMIEFDSEFILSINEDPVFGKTLMFGLGGIYVETIKDIAFGICPITRLDAKRIINELRSSKILKGTRGKVGVDEETIIDLLLSFGGENGIASKAGDLIKTVEVNPIVVDRNRKCFVALDAVVTLASQDKKNQKQIDKVDMHSLYHPNNIAVFGASNKPGMGKIFIEETIKGGYKGNIYPINPSHVNEELLGYKIYGNINDTPEPIDYAYVAVPAKAVKAVIEDCAKKGVKFVHIISGGFGEVGEDGKLLEKQMVEIANKAGMRLVGPNCMGMVSASEGIFFTTGVGKTPGNVSIISQSGGITTEMLRAGSASGIKFNVAASIGNCIDLGLEEFLEYLGDDENTKVIGLYSESLNNGKEFYRILKEVCKKKPVVIIKGGRSLAGAKAASSHTGALASSFVLWEALSKQTGATLVKTLEEFLNALLAYQNLDYKDDNSVLLVSHSGGVVVTSTDLSEDYGLTLPKVKDDLQVELKKMQLPPGANVSNPMDISLGVMASKTSADDKMTVIGDVFEKVSMVQEYGYYVMYLMADNVVESGGGKNLIENIFDFSKKFGGTNGTHHGSYILAANCHTHPDYINKLKEDARKEGVMILNNVNETLQCIGWLTKYGSFRKEIKEYE